MSQKQYAYFSAAIRHGATVREQAFSMTLDFLGRTCAFGAGLDAMGILPTALEIASVPYALYEQVKDLFPYLRQNANCPVCGSEMMDVADAALHLNDTHKRSREQIADWLYAEEEKLGFVTLTEETEAFKPRMIAESSTLEATGVFGFG